MSNIVSILAALLALPGLALGAEYSGDLEGATPRQEGFASVVATNAGTITFTIATNGIGVPTSATVWQDGSLLVDLEAEFFGGTATGTLASGLDLSGVGNLLLRVEGPDGTVEAPLVLLPGADINATPLQRDFGEVAVGSSSPARAIRVSNDGTANLRLGGQVFIRGAGRARYSLVSEDCSGRVLAPGAACTIQVRFSPTAPGEARALAVLNSTDRNEPQVRVQLRGTGI